MSMVRTPSQTVGPFFSIGLSYPNADDLSQHPSAEQIEICGQVFDGAGDPIPDALLELWQADPQGRFSGFATDPSTQTDPGFHGFARIAVDERGAFRLHTVRPGPVSAPNQARQAPHIVVLIFMRGLLKHLISRIYLAGDPLNASDPVLLAVPQERRSTLIAQQQKESPNRYQWNLYMQGEHETVFFLY
jgi:protocatechuate 3,4-dioxygenase alpha subunit